MALWKITCPECGYSEGFVRIDMDDFPEKEQREYLDRIRQNNPDWEE